METGSGEETHHEPFGDESNADDDDQLEGGLEPAPADFRVGSLRRKLPGESRQAREAARRLAGQSVQRLDLA